MVIYLAHGGGQVVGCSTHNLKVMSLKPSDINGKLKHKIKAKELSSIKKSIHPILIKI